MIVAVLYVVGVVYLCVGVSFVTSLVWEVWKAANEHRRKYLRER